MAAAKNKTGGCPPCPQFYSRADRGRRTAGHHEVSPLFGFTPREEEGNWADNDLSELRGPAYLHLSWSGVEGGVDTETTAICVIVTGLGVMPYLHCVFFTGLGVMPHLHCVLHWSWCNAIPTLCVLYETPSTVHLARPVNMMCACVVSNVCECVCGCVCFCTCVTVCVCSPVFHLSNQFIIHWFVFFFFFSFFIPSFWLCQSLKGRVRMFGFPLLTFTSPLFIFLLAESWSWWFESLSKDKGSVITVCSHVTLVNIVYYWQAVAHDTHRLSWCPMLSIPLRYLFTRCSLSCISSALMFVKHELTSMLINSLKAMVWLRFEMSDIMS